MASPLNVLISGAGIAGPVAAFFLSKAGARVTVVERSRALRTGGQAVDVRGHGLTILRRMGLEEAAREKATGEAGVQLVDCQGHASVEFPVGNGEGFTGQIEIARGELASIFYRATRHNVHYVSGDSIREISEDRDGMQVNFQSGASDRSFDIVVGADGWASTTRALAFGSHVSTAAVKPLQQWAAWFRIPRSPADDNWARWYTAAGRRMILTRPDTEAVIGVSLWISTSSHELSELTDACMAEQKAYWSRLFVDVGWQEDRILCGLQDADDCYMQEIAQVKMGRLWRNRVALIGDAASCPCPISGMGTTVSIVGAYILAGELLDKPHAHQAAFAAYEGKMQPFVDQAQKLAPCAPGMVTLDSPWSIRLLHILIRLVAWTGIVHLVARWFSPPARAMALPLYDFGYESHGDARATRPKTGPAAAPAGRMKSTTFADSGYSSALEDSHQS